MIGRDYPAPIVDHKRASASGRSSATAPSRLTRARRYRCRRHGASSTSSATSRRASRRCTSPASGRCRTCRRRTTGSGATSWSTSGSPRACTAAASSTSRAARATAAPCSARTAASVVGVDANPEAFEHARLKYTRRDRRVRARHDRDLDGRRRLRRVPADDRARAGPRRGARRACATLVGPGGVAYVSTPNVLTLAPDGAERSGNPWHVREYRPEEFRALCERHFGARRPARPVPRAQAAPAPARDRARRLGRRPRAAAASRSRSTTASRRRSPRATSALRRGGLDRALDLLAVLRP